MIISSIFVLSYGIVFIALFKTISSKF